jgi:hypothetical protein
MYKTSAYIVSFIHLNETKQMVFGSRIKAALFVARHERALQAWHVEFTEVDTPGFAIPCTLQIRTAVDRLQVKLGLRGTDTEYLKYAAKEDSLLQDARRVLRKL